MPDPVLLRQTDVYAVIDAAIRKDISWTEARARLRKMLEHHPELFSGMTQEAVKSLRDGRQLEPYTEDQAERERRQQPTS